MRQKQTVDARLRSVCPGLQMGLVCPLVLGVKISVTFHWSFSETPHLAGGIQARAPSPEFPAAGSSKPREIRAERTLPWEAGHLVLIRHPVCLLGDLGQVTLPPWAELLHHTLGWRQGAWMLAGALYGSRVTWKHHRKQELGVSPEAHGGRLPPRVEGSRLAPLGGVSRAVFASFAAAAGGAPIRRHADRAGQIH